MRILINIAAITFIISTLLAWYGLVNRRAVVNYDQQISDAQSISKELDDELANNTQSSTNISFDDHNLINKYPVDYLIADSDRRLITDDELLGKEVDFLKLARAEIYARKGFKFKSLELARFFEDKIWYLLIASNSKISDFTQLQLNDIEKNNIEKISRYEFEFYKKLFNKLSVQNRQ